MIAFLGLFGLVENARGGSYSTSVGRTRMPGPGLLHRCIKEVTDVIVHDIFSPPVASRIYAYITVAGYEAARREDTSFVSFVGRLHGLDAVPVPDAGRRYDFSLASVQAVLTVGKALVISEEKIEAYREKLLEEMRTGLPQDVFANSVESVKEN